MKSSFLRALKTNKTKNEPFFIGGKMDVTFLVIVLVLVAIGLIMMFSASYAYAYYYQKGNSLYYIKRQFPFALLGIAAMLVISRFNYRKLQDYSLLMYGLSLILLFIVLFMPRINGCKRWIFIGPVNFQPSEIAKLAIVLILSTKIITYGQAKMKRFEYGYLYMGAWVAPVAVLMLLEPHLSGTILIFSLAAVLMFVGGSDVKLFLLFAVAVAGFATLIVIFPDLLSIIAQYAGTRIEIWHDPFSDPLGAGYQTVQSLYAIGSGGLMGTGIGGSRQKYLYLPEPCNDFIFAVVCEELGFIGAVLILAIFALLVWRGFAIAARCKDKFGTLIATGLTAQVGIQALFNVAVVTNTIPNTGISLPFFSYGGTSLMMLLAEMGLVLSVSRNASIEKE